MTLVITLLTAMLSVIAKDICDAMACSTKPASNEGFWPSREAALTHLRELEAKERPVIDLSTAKFGDKFKRRDGKIETYACPMEGGHDWHVMQSSETYTPDGRYMKDRCGSADLISVYVPPQTVTYWLAVWHSGEVVCRGLATTLEGANDLLANRDPFCAPVKITLTEGEGLAEPDVA